MRSPSVSSIYDGLRGLKTYRYIYTFARKHLLKRIHILDFLKKSAVILASHEGGFRGARGEG